MGIECAVSDPKKPIPTPISTILTDHLDSCSVKGGLVLHESLIISQNSIQGWGSYSMRS